MKQCWEYISHQDSAYLITVHMTNLNTKDYVQLFMWLLIYSKRTKLMAHYLLDGEDFESAFNKAKTYNNIKHGRNKYFPEKSRKS